MAIWWFLFRSNIEWPFVLQYSSSPLDFGLLPFLWVPSLVRSILVTLRQIYFLQCSSFGEVDFDDLETRLLTFLVTFFGVVDFVDFEVLIYFLQCASFGGVDRFDPEARFCFFTVRLLQ